MASPPGANSAASSSRGAPLPLPLPFPFAAAAHFPSRAAVPFMPQQHHLSPTSDGDEEVEEDDDDIGEKDEAELEDGAALGPQQRRASSAPGESGIGRAAMNGENGVRHIQEGHQWQKQSHLYSRGTEHYGSTSSGGDEPGTIPREMSVENGYGVIGRREGGPASSYWDLLRAHLSDPLTGVLMDDAMILSCGHSYGSGGMQHIYRMLIKQEYVHCLPVSFPSVVMQTLYPAISCTAQVFSSSVALRLAVQAFKREEDSAKTLKRRRERLEQGNKRTPERFVGRQAVVTAQCLNGWYVVKTLDNAESVKLQYRSLEKVAGGNGASAMVSNNAQSASWL